MVHISYTHDFEWMATFLFTKSIRAGRCPNETLATASVCRPPENRTVFVSKRKVVIYLNKVFVSICDTFFCVIF